MEIWDLFDMTKDEYQIGMSVMRKLPMLRPFAPMVTELEEKMRIQSELRDTRTEPKL